jgi:hypothetical protein
MKKYLQLLLVLPLLAACTKKAGDDGIVRIGQKTISKAQFESFEKATRMYPTTTGSLFPGYRPTITHLVETDLIFRQGASGSVKDSLKKTDDWKWKQRYFPAQQFLLEYLVENLGVPDEKLKSFYTARKDSFKVTVKVTTPPKDSTSKDTLSKDSTYYKPFEEVKRAIVDSVFLQESRPDSVFLSKLDTSASVQQKNEQWLNYVRENIGSYFMKKIYKEMTGKTYPDSLNEVFGEGKYITKPDMDVILSWIPAERREFYAKDEQKRELVEWLVKWKLFSAYAEKLGRNKLPASKNLMDWAWKLEVAYAYVNTRLEPALKAAIVIDTTMLQYAYYDENGYAPAVEKNSDRLGGKINAEREEQLRMKIDSVLISYRKANPVTFLQKDWIDTKSDNPAELLKKADALRDSGKSNEARDAYQNLAKDFVYSAEGQTALVELAKLQTEQQLYTQAIGNYRKYLILSPDKSKRCNTFFMIGFIYDEYLDQPKNAEENYKWVLKNAPDCELADDAEFMMLHLGEPMSSVEELRDEALRQGRKVDDAAEASVDTAQAASAK